MPTGWLAGGLAGGGWDPGFLWIFIDFHGFCTILYHFTSIFHGFLLILYDFICILCDFMQFSYDFILILCDLLLFIVFHMILFNFI